MDNGFHIMLWNRAIYFPAIFICHPLWTIQKSLRPSVCTVRSLLLQSLSTHFYGSEKENNIKLRTCLARELCLSRKLIKDIIRIAKISYIIFIIFEWFWWFTCKLKSEDMIVYRLRTKKSGLKGIPTRDFCDTSAVLFQLSYHVNRELVTLWVRDKPAG